MYKYLLVLLLSINVTFASGAKLIDYLVNSSDLVKVLGDHGIYGNDAKQVSSYVASSLAALGVKENNSQKDLLAVLAKLPLIGEDATKRRALQELLDKNGRNTFKKSEVVTAINNLIYFANRHGKSILITCAECVNDKLSKDGFTFAVGAIKDATTKQLLDKTIPADPAQLNKFISSKMTSLKMGDYSKVTPAMLKKEEEKTLALFLALAEKGTPDQKALINSIKNASTGADGKTNLFDAKNPHKFWKILADDMTADEMKGWATTLDTVAARAKKDKISVEDAFYRTLADKTKGDEALARDLATLKQKGCFFK